MPSPDDTIAALKLLVPELQSRFSVRHLALFGSAARGQEADGSDLDLLVEFQPAATVTLFTLAAMKSFLESHLKRPVDLVENHAGLRAAFRREIEKDLRRVA